MKAVQLTVGSAVLLTVSAVSQANTDDAAAQIAALEARVAELEATDTDRWLTEERSEEIRELVTDVLADADTRASLMSSRFGADYDNGAVIGDAEGNWQIKTRFLMQQRFLYNNQDEMSATDTDRWGFENTRSKFYISGHVVDPSWRYVIDINVGSGVGRTGVGNAYIAHDYDENNTILMGSMKVPLVREDMVTAENQLAIERSVLSYAFTGGYADGIAWHHRQDKWRLWASFNDGAGTGQTAALAMDTEYSITGRFEFLFDGTWSQFDDFTSMKGDTGGVMAGAAAHYQKGEYGTAATETEVLIFTADVSWEGDGANAFGAFYYADIDTGVGGSTNPTGFSIQGGLFLDEDWELFARYEWADWDTASEDLSIVTVGVTRYFAGQNMKWTTDLGYGLDAVNTGGINGAPAAITGFRTDSGSEDGQFVVRTQWQLFF